MRQAGYSYSIAGVGETEEEVESGRHCRHSTVSLNGEDRQTDRLSLPFPTVFHFVLCLVTKPREQSNSPSMAPLSVQALGSVRDRASVALPMWGVQCLLPLFVRRHGRLNEERKRNTSSHPWVLRSFGIEVMRAWQPRTVTNAASELSNGDRGRGSIHSTIQQSI
jgi:hypothetical protein